MHREETKERPVVRDDEEGHLVYKNGDILDKRCNHSSLLIRLQLSSRCVSVCLCVRVSVRVCVACSALGIFCPAVCGRAVASSQHVARAAVHRVTPPLPLFR